MSAYESVIGLEVHVQLQTATKIFCSCRNIFGADPNTNICPTCLGLPGALPVLNKRALELATRASLALGGTIADRMKFDRKNYFYPDLPKAYQISQFDLPLSSGGGIALSNGRFVALTRIHLEEDAGKLLHTSESLDDSEFTRVDLNRAGTPLIEIVTEPDIRTAEEANEFLTVLKQAMEYAEVSDCNMEEGSLRCDANVSIRPEGESKLGVKVEVKNLNSFKAVQAAIRYEIERQRKCLAAGQEIVQETRLWDPDRGQTRGMRSKEESHDYRYFPDPDLVTFTIDRAFVERERANLPELPRDRAARFVRDYALTEYDAGVLTSAKPLADFFEAATRSYPKNPKAIANWITAELLRELSDADPSSAKLSPESLGELVALIDDGTITGKIGKDLFAELVRDGGSARALVETKGLRQITDEGAIETACKEAIAENPQALEQFRAGKKNALGFLVGAVMKKTSGKANPPLVNKILTRLMS